MKNKPELLVSRINKDKFIASVRGDNGVVIDCTLDKEQMRIWVGALDNKIT